MKNTIDFVLLWVDGSDPKWQEARRSYCPEKKEDTSDSRYRDWDNLQYWFRGVEKFAPWVNCIYFVTCGQQPRWLNTEHPRLRMVSHRDFMNPEYLPTFSSHPIELNLHRIEGLSEQFVYFNDDTFLIQNTTEEDFFKNGLPRDCCIETALSQDRIDDPFAHILLNNAALVNMHYKKREVIKKQWKKWFSPAYGAMALRNLLMLPYREFSGFKYTHMPSAFLKSSYEQLWREEGAFLDQVCRHRFRSPADVNQYVIKHWQCMEGNYVPQSPSVGRFCVMGRDDRLLYETLRRQSAKMVCINDDARVTDFPGTKKKVREALERLLPERSSFERV